MNWYPWVKSLHILSVIAWYCGLMYLPRLFVYHAMSEDQVSKDRFKIMERKLYFGIMTPSAILTLIFGIWLWFGMGFNGLWLNIKVTLVFVLLLFHIYCFRVYQDFKLEKNVRSHRFYRWMNEFPFLILICNVILVVVKPWS